MGLPRAAIKLIAETVRNHKICGRVLIIGKQDVWGTEQEVVRWLRESDLTPAPSQPLISGKPDFRRLNFIQDTSLFELMGFRDVVTLDYSDYEGAQLICDLNRPLSSDLLAKAGSFDLIVESGCLEHIFNVPRVLENLYHLAAEDGIVIHVAASSNLVDHGFYMFSPTLFQDYYSANHWQILQHYFFQNSPNYKARWKIYKYKPGALLPFAFTGGLNRAMCGIYLAARKQSGATCDAAIQQGMFLAAWADKADGGKLGRAASSKVGWPALRERLKPYIPKALIPILMTLEARLNTLGGVGRYLEHYKNL
jgi:hypothetical protein